MKTIEKISITAEHLAIIRQKYDCEGMTNKEIIVAMFSYEKKYGSGCVNILDYLCFPSFQSILYYEKKLK